MNIQIYVLFRAVTAGVGKNEKKHDKKVFFIFNLYCLLTIVILNDRKTTFKHKYVGKI